MQDAAKPFRLGNLPDRKKLQTRAGTLEYVVSGTGPCTLVLLNGAGVTLEGWRALYPAIEKIGTVFAWNRFGVKGSDAPRLPQTGAVVVASLRELLSYAGLTPPYVLVGHSLGGLYANLFARLYPQEVAAVLFLEATHPRDREVLQQHETQLTRALTKVFSLPQWLFKANLHSEIDCLDHAVSEVEAAGPFPAIPVAVVTGGATPPRWLMSPGALQARRAHQQELARLSPKGEQVIAAKSGHFPQLTEPRLVIDVLKRLTARAACWTSAAALATLARMNETAEPLDPVSAVVHRDPYPYYARLRRDRPLYLDSTLGLWVAATHETVEAALNHPALRVRPPAEPVPRGLVGTPAGEVFARLVRMNDGEFHSRYKPAVQQAVRRFSMADVAQAAAAAALAVTRLEANALLNALPVQAVARLLRVPLDSLNATVRWVEEFVQGIAPGASALVVARANDAAMQLMAQGEAQGLDAVQSANRIALMQQSLDATAGLVGNTVRLLRARPELVAGESSLDPWRAIVAEVARWDAPVQNTRRFAATDLTLGGQAIAQGQGVLLLLASANRDETLNANPDIFDPERSDRRSMSFGAGMHGCPGEAIAIEIAAAGLQALSGERPLDELFGPCSGFRPLANARIPVFAT